MEVHLDSVGNGPLPTEDVFLSFRVGDVQKQSRFSKSRIYRFPDSGLGRDRFGRLEVYRRVGALTVSLDSAAEDGQDVFIPCELSGADQLGFRMAVRGGSTKGDALPTMEQRGRASKRMDAAQRYMAEHKLEEILAEAMREVLQTKPGDPLSFLSELLLKQRKAGQEDSLPPIPGLKEEKPRKEPDNRQKAFEKLLPVGRTSPELPSKASPPPPTSPPPAAASPPPPPPSTKAPVEGVGNARPHRKSLNRTSKATILQEEMQEKAVKPPPGPAAAEPFGSRSYYAAHIAGASGRAMSDGLAGLYSKFSRAQPAKPAAPGSEGESGGFGAYYSQHLASNTGSRGLADLYGKFAAARTAAPAAPETALVQEGFKAYYAANVVCSRTGFDRLYSKFEAVSQAKPAEELQKQTPGSREYYAANVVCNVSSAGLSGLYSKFEAFATAQSRTEAPAPGSRAYYAANVACKSSSTGLAGLYGKFEAFTEATSHAEAQAPAPGSGAYYAANIACSSSSPGFAGLYGKFEAFSNAPAPAPGPKPYNGASLLGFPEVEAPKAEPQGPLLEGGMAAYCGKHMPGTCGGALATLHSKFHVQGRQQATAAPGPIPVLSGQGFATYYQDNLLGGDVKKTAKVAQDLLLKFGSFAAATDQNSAQHAPAPNQAKFIYQASVGSWLTRTPAQVTPSWCFAKVEEAVQEEAKFIYQASVGSWLTRTPAQVTPSWCFAKPDEATREEATKPHPEAAKPNFAYRASVGSWLTRTPPQVSSSSSWCFVKSEAATSQAVAAEVPLTAQPAAAQPAQSVYKMKASVGTWLVQKPPKLQPERSPAAAPPPPPAERDPWKYRPSVGSWLNKTPAKIEVTSVVPKPTGGLLARRQDSLLKMEPTVLLAVFQAELEAKDREIDKLRRLLRTAR